jgi:hypothetical protein
MKARISQLHKTEAEWQKFSSWIPEPGELVVYDPDGSYAHARVKVGDGKRTLSELDFFITSTIEDVLKQIRFEESVDGGRITEYSKN